MCTAFNTKNFFGRNLDYEHRFGEKIIIIPHEYPLSFENKAPLKNHPAIIGVGLVENGCPLLFDAMNEYGLGVAGLNFPSYAHYFKEGTLPSYEVILFILTRAKSAKEAKELLRGELISDTPFSDNLTPSPLHWIVSDENESLVIEQTKNGLSLFDNPVHLLSNAPPFPHQLSFLDFYLNITSRPAENRFGNLPLTPFSRGMGGIGLPGDLSSPSRLVRGAFMRANSKEDTLSQFFHLLSSVEQIDGAAEVENEQYEKTLYSSAYERKSLTLYCTTYENRRINAFTLQKNLGKNLVTFDMEIKEDIKKRQ